MTTKAILRHQRQDLAQGFVKQEAAVDRVNLDPWVLLPEVTRELAGGKADKQSGSALARPVDYKIQVLTTFGSEPPFPLLLPPPPGKTSIVTPIFR